MRAVLFGIALSCLYLGQAVGQTVQPAAAPNAKVESLQKRVDVLERELVEVKAELDSMRMAGPVTTQPMVEPSSTLVATAASPADAPSTSPVPVTTAVVTETAPTQGLKLLPASSTLNLIFDGYYGYNLNHSAGRVNQLRAYDVLSNVFSLNQAAVVFELPADPANGRRFGARLDLQFGQATATLQGNNANENRPDVYRNIFQAYGRYVAPIGHGLTVDFGKWASSLGFEGNYTKDQLNYTRSFYFNYLPFYHMGVRASYPINDRVAVNYWIVNGTDQTEPFNSFKDELFGLNLTPTHNINWTVNYYVGQEHPDVTPATNCTVPLQPGLCFTPIVDAPNGKTHFFDSYMSWQATPKWMFAVEGDYAIEREWATASPGHSSAPSHVDGGAAYMQYQFTPKFSVASRAEYLNDRGGLFSSTTQALKEGTSTATYRLHDGFMTMLEYRRDWSNQAYFMRGNAGAHVGHQDTATLGLIWWYGGKKGPW